jgi:hypothetical protein
MCITSNRRRMIASPRAVQSQNQRHRPEEPRPNDSRGMVRAGRVRSCRRLRHDAFEPVVASHPARRLASSIPLHTMNPQQVAVTPLGGGNLVILGHSHRALRTPIPDQLGRVALNQRALRGGFRIHLTGRDDTRADPSIGSQIQPTNRCCSGIVCKHAAESKIGRLTEPATDGLPREVPRCATALEQCVIRLPLDCRRGARQTRRGGCHCFGATNYLRFAVLQPPVSGLRSPAFRLRVPHPASFDGLTWGRRWLWCRSSGWGTDRCRLRHPLRGFRHWRRRPPGFRCAPPGATIRHPLRGLLGIVLLYVYRSPTRSAANRRSRRHPLRGLLGIVLLYVYRSPTRSAANRRSRRHPLRGFLGIVLLYVYRSPTRSAANRRSRRHPLRGFLGIVLSVVHRLSTRSAANRRSRLGVGDGPMPIASPSSRVQTLETPPPRVPLRSTRGYNPSPAARVPWHRLAVCLSIADAKRRKPTKSASPAAWVPWHRLAVCLSIADAKRSKPTKSASPAARVSWHRLAVCLSIADAKRSKPTKSASPAARVSWHRFVGCPSTVHAKRRKPTKSGRGGGRTEHRESSS